jgi:hypothetical protein
MKIIIGFILLYIILVISGASLFRLIWNAGYKGTKLEETWKSSLTKFGILNFIAGLIIIMIFSIFHFFF